MPLPTGTRIGACEITLLIGAGGMGEVYRAHDTILNRDVALKVLPEHFAEDPDRLGRFKREAQLLASLNHPNIAAIYGFEDVGAGFSRLGGALVMELVEGPTLADRIAQGLLPLDEALPIARQIAEALEAAHEQGIVHRDLKPANIKVRADGTVKVLDFGLAKALESEAAPSASLSMSPTMTSPANTRLGVILGTAAYMSPEQARGKPVDRRADIWAFGAVLYEMLTGRRAFDGDEVSDVLAYVLTREPVWNAPPKNTPPGIHRILERCLAKDPRKRWQAAGDVRIELDSALSTSPRVDGAAPDTAMNRRMWRLALPAAVGAIVAFAAGMIWDMQSGSPSPVAARFSVAPPQGQFTAMSRHMVAISPDGANVAYIANAQLYLRPLGDLESRPVRGASYAGTAINSPFFSPDGQWVGFWTISDNTIKKVPIGGGTPITVARADDVLGASWADNTVIWANENGGISAVSDNGGSAEVWVKPAAGELLANPRILPGGNAILFTSRPEGTGDWDAADIAVFSRDSGMRKVLVRGGSAAVYLLSGHIVYAVGGSLLAVPFDVDRLEVVGNPVTVLEGMMRLPPDQSAAPAAHFSVSENGTLAYVQGAVQNAPPRQLVWVDRQGAEEPTSMPPRRISDPRLSIDGGRVAMHIADQGSEIWTFEIGRGAMTRHTFEPPEDETPMWSPDGQWLAYASSRGNERIVFRRRADGSRPEEVLWKKSLPGHTHVEDWTSDGNVLISTSDSVNSDTDLALLGVSGNQPPKPLLETKFSEHTARISPDGRWLAYSSDESGRREVYVQPFPSLDGKWQVSTGGGTEPIWSRRGDEIFYRGEGGIYAVRFSSTPTFTPGPPARLFADQYLRVNVHTGYDVAADGRRFLMVKDDVPQVRPALGSAAGPASLTTAEPPRIVVVQNWVDELRRLAPPD